MLPICLSYHWQDISDQFRDFCFVFVKNLRLMNANEEWMVLKSETCVETFISFFVVSVVALRWWDIEEEALFSESELTAAQVPGDWGNNHFTSLALSFLICKMKMLNRRLLNLLSSVLWLCKKWSHLDLSNVSF